MTMEELDAWLKANPAPASDEETLALEPNNAPPEGPHPQIDPNAYVTMTKPDGTTFLSPLSNVPDYEARGFTAGTEEDIPDLVAYWAEKAATEPAAPVAPVEEAPPP